MAKTMIKNKLYLYIAIYIAVGFLIVTVIVISSSRNEPVITEPERGGPEQSCLDILPIQSTESMFVMRYVGKKSGYDQVVVESESTQGRKNAVVNLIKLNCDLDKIDIDFEDFGNRFIYENGDYL